MLTEAHGSPQVEDELRSILACMCSPRRHSISPQVEDELRSIQDGLAKETASGGGARGGAGGGRARDNASPATTLRMLWQSRRTRRALVVCSTLQLCQQFCGVNAIVYFTPSILKKAGAPAMFAALGVTQPDVAAMLATVPNAITAVIRVPSECPLSAL